MQQRCIWSHPDFNCHCRWHLSPMGFSPNCTPASPIHISDDRVDTRKGWRNPCVSCKQINPILCDLLNYRTPTHSWRGHCRLMHLKWCQLLEFKWWPGIEQAAMSTNWRTAKHERALGHFFPGRVTEHGDRLPGEAVGSPSQEPSGHINAL